MSFESVSLYLSSECMQSFQFASTDCARLIERLDGEIERFKIPGGRDARKGDVVPSFKGLMTRCSAAGPDGSINEASARIVEWELRGNSQRPPGPRRRRDITLFTGHPPDTVPSHHPQPSPKHGVPFYIEQLVSRIIHAAHKQWPSSPESLALRQASLSSAGENRRRPPACGCGYRRHAKHCSASVSPLSPRRRPSRLALGSDGLDVDSSRQAQRQLNHVRAPTESVPRTLPSLSGSLDEGSPRYHAAPISPFTKSRISPGAPWSVPAAGISPVYHHPAVHTTGTYALSSSTQGSGMPPLRIPHPNYSSHCSPHGYLTGPEAPSSPLQDSGVAPFWIPNPNYSPHYKPHGYSTSPETPSSPLQGFAVPTSEIPPLSLDGLGEVFTGRQEQEPHQKQNQEQQQEQDQDQEQDQEQAQDQELLSPSSSHKRSLRNRQRSSSLSSTSSSETAHPKKKPRGRQNPSPLAQRHPAPHPAAFDSSQIESIRETAARVVEGMQQGESAPAPVDAPTTPESIDGATTSQDNMGRAGGSTQAQEEPLTAPFSPPPRAFGLPVIGDPGKRPTKRSRKNT